MVFRAQLFVFDEPRHTILPSKVKLKVPQQSALSKKHLRSLVYIPWSESYFTNIPSQYRAFFTNVLPYLGVRTTDVHTAVSVGFVRELIDRFPGTVNERVVYVALMLHDCGWGMVSEEVIANSFQTGGLHHPDEARTVAVELSHEAQGALLAAKLLRRYALKPALTAAEKNLVVAIVRHHTHANLLDDTGQQNPEVVLVREADHLWSYTHDNFWQDTVRKDQAPAEYLSTLETSIPSYFATEAGAAIAGRLCSERREELAALETFTKA